MAIAPEVLADIRKARTEFLNVFMERDPSPERGGRVLGLIVRIGMKHGVPAMVGLLMLLPESAMGLASVIKSLHVMPRADLEVFVRACAPHLDEFTLDQLQDFGRRAINPDQDALVSFGAELFDCLD